MKISKIWPKKISWRLTIVYSFIFILVLLLVNSVAYFIFKNHMEANVKASIDSTLEFVLPKLNGVDRKSFDSYAADILQDISKSEGNIYFRIIDYNKNIVAQSNILNNIKIPIQPGLNKFNTEDKKFVVKTIMISKYGFLNGYLQVVRDVSFEYDFLDVLLIILMVTSGVGSIGAIIISYTITRKTLEPINKITNAARNISVSDLGKRLRIEGPDDELNNLVQTFNSMLQRLEKAFNREQQFVSDASHELRTPISVIQGYINLLDRWGKDEVEIRDEAIDAIKNEVKSMEKLVQSLLFLARGESDNLEIKKEQFWVDEVVDELVRESSMISEGIEVYTKKNEHIEFYGDEKMIKQLLRIFIDNSLKYSNEGSQVIISSVKKNNNLELTVKDTGRGIPEEDIPHIFDRFYRVDKSRSTKKGGAGLGLSIAKWIIDNHNGQVNVKSELGKGTEIIVTLPDEN